MTWAPVLAGLAAASATAMSLHGPRPPHRIRAMRIDGGVGSAEARSSTGAARLLGRLVRRRLLRRHHDDPAAERRTGVFVIVVALGAVVDPLLGLLAGAACVVGARAGRLRRQGRSRRTRAVETDLPELVDLLALTTAAGLTVADSLRAAAPCAPGALRSHVHDAVHAIASGGRIEAAVLTLGERWGDPARPLVHALVDHVRYGTPLLPALERVGTEARNRRRRAAEARARRLPVLLLFPLVLCTLPAFGLLTVAPLVAGTLGSLDGSPLEAPASVTP